MSDCLFMEIVIIQDYLRIEIANVNLITERPGKGN